MLKLEYNSYKYSDKWTKIGVNAGICLGNNQGNIQLHRFTTSENIAKSFSGATSLTYTACVICFVSVILYVLCVEVREIKMMNENERRVVWD